MLNLSCITIFNKVKIPHTTKIDLADIDLHIPESELFSFYIEEFKEQTYLSKFIEKLDIYLPDFVFSKKNLEIKTNQYNGGKTTVSPLEQARSLLQKTKLEYLHNSTGEFGEFLMYLFAKEVMGAQKIVSKIQSRGNPMNTIPGRDGIFMLIDENENVYMLTGEAKMKPDGNDGLREAQGDLNKFWLSNDIKHELLLASTHLIDEVTDENYQKYEQYFLQGNQMNDNLKYKNIIFVGYSCDNFTKVKNGEIGIEDFILSTENNLSRCFKNQKELIISGNKSAIYCFVPFETVNDAREQFARHNGLLLN